ncbi:MAG: UvrD-helicase domain-containing protein [Ktedonobacteraceae bacterium]|nr:UvrD-helicase domain-containing protein [Ktedonobacteraceae bacterium]
MSLQSTAEQAARLLVQAYRAEHPEHPAWNTCRTPVDELLPWLGLHVETFHPDDQPDGTFGFVDPDEDEGLIWLCRDLPETLRRFTLAHELGHAILHCRPGSRFRSLPALSAQFAALAEVLPAFAAPSGSDPCHEADVQEFLVFDEEQLQDTLGIGLHYDPRSQREMAANFFAAELLMPLAQVRALYLERRIPAGELAATFGVSNTALLNRLAGLLTTPTPPPPATPMTPAPPAPPAIQPATPQKKVYDEFQQAAIETTTPALIVAGPGSGKTSTLIGRVEHVIRNLHVHPRHILALTFSRKAAQEMEERLRILLNDLPFVAGVPGITGALPTVSTFHAFCADLLRTYGTQVGLRPDFTLIDEVEGYFILRQQANRLHLRHYQHLRTPDLYFPDLLKAISRAKDELVSPAQYARLGEQMLLQAMQAANAEAREQAEKVLEVAHVYELYEQTLRRRGDTDFGGLLTLAIQLLREQPAVLQEVQQQYQHILVDEFQDMNRASGVLLRELAGEQRNVWVVGDANQAIYGFRGASPANISQFEADYPGATILPLSRNYRSRPALVTIAESFRTTLLEPGQSPGKNQPVRADHASPYVTLAQADSEESELAGLLQDIRQKVSAGYSYQDMAILCRKRSQAQKIARVLAAEGLPTRERGGIFEQEHIKSALSPVLLLADASGMGLLRAARMPDHPIAQEDIEAFLQAAWEQKTPPGTWLLTGEVPPTVSAEGYATFKRLAGILQTLQRLPDTWSLLAQYLLIESSLVRDLLINGGNERNRALLADYEKLLQLARRHDQLWQARQRQSEQEMRTNNKEAQEASTLAEQARSLLDFLNLLLLLRQDGSRQQPDEEETAGANAIHIMTVHASKGLEFPIVYLPGLVKRNFPLDRRGSRIPPPEGMLPPESEGEMAHTINESCLFYVGVTRARDHLVLSYCERKNGYIRSPYLDALLANLPPARIQHQQWSAATVGMVNRSAEASPLSIQPGVAFIRAMKPAALHAHDLETYQHCPRQYLYSSIYHFNSAASGYLLFIQATRKTIEALHRQVRPRSKRADSAQSPPLTLPSPQEIQQVYIQHWQDLGGPAAPFAAMYEQHGREVVEAVLHKLAGEKEADWHLNHDFTVELAGRSVQVTVDRVETPSQAAAGEQPVRFVRTRFSNSKSQPDPDIRDLLYALAYRQHFPDQEAEIYSHNMSKNELMPRKLSPRVEKNRYEKAASSLERLERDAYPPQPEKADACQNCPFFFICPA